MESHSGNMKAESTFKAVNSVARLLTSLIWHMVVHKAILILSTSALRLISPVPPPYHTHVHM